MKELVFKTDIQDLTQVKLLEDKLNVALGFREWSFDLNSTNKLFKVIVLSTNPSEIIKLFNSLGHSCEEF